MNQALREILRIELTKCAEQMKATGATKGYVVLEPAPYVPPRPQMLHAPR